MYTRELEDNRVLRASVDRARVLASDACGATLATEAVAASRKKISSADPAMLERRLQARVGKRVEGRLRLDVVGEGILRVRYAEGADAFPGGGESPMLDGPLPAPPVCEVAAGPDRLTLRAAAFRAEVALDPFRIEVFDAAGRRACGVGGPEKNHFCEWDAYNTGVCRTAEGGRPLAVECFDLRPGEAVYGLGETFLGLDKVGQRLDLSVTDPHGVTTPRCYKCVPFFVSSLGYGVFFHHTAPMTFWVGSLSAADVTAAVQDDYLDYFVIVGSIREVLARYADLTGRPPVPPDWSFGFWQSKLSYRSAEEVLEVARELRRHEVPCDVIHLDTHWFREDWLCDLAFDPERFPDPAGLFAELARMGFRVSLWQLPYLPEGSALFEALRAVDGFVKTAGGGLYDCGICYARGFRGAVGVVDYTNPEAVRVHGEHLRRLLRLGARVVKTDFGEEAPPDGVYADGTPGHRMHNLYPLLYNRAVFEATAAETGEGLVWARSAWAGSQRYPVHWGGDNSPNFANMAPQLAGGLSLGLSGFPFWSQDIGGFCGETNDRLLVRWMQMGLFLSHARIHGTGPRELYRFAPETLRICRDFLRLRYRLLPYLLGQAAACARGLLPMARALVVEFQDDPNVRDLADEYLLGDALLVAPVCTPEDARRVYLPAGTWTDWWTGERIAGGRWLEAAVPLDRLPLYLREGALVPLGPERQYVGERPVDRVTVRVARFEGDGRAAFSAPVEGGVLALDYEAAGGRHRVRFSAPEGVRVAFDAPGPGGLAVEREGSP